MFFFNRNSLLTEGLRFLMDIYHMFIPIDNIRCGNVGVYVGVCACMALLCVSM